MKRILCVVLVLTLATPALAQNTARWEEVDFTSSAGCDYAAASSSSSRWYWDMVQDAAVTFGFNFTRNYQSAQRNTKRLDWSISGVGVDAINKNHNISYPRDDNGRGV